MKNMYRIIATMVFLSLSLLLQAQKAELSEIKTCLKENKNLDVADSLIRKVIAMPKEKNNIRHYLTLTEIRRKKYENSNEKLYLRQLKDTASLFPVLRRMFLAYESLDSIDALPDKKGKVAPKHRKKNAAFLHLLRQNLYNGGIFSAKKQNYSETFDCMDLYLDACRQPLFSHYNYLQEDKQLPQAAYWAAVSARKLKRYSLMTKYLDLALANRDNAPLVLAMLHEAFVENNEPKKAVEYLKKGFREYSEFPYFFPRLVDYYSQKNEIDSVKQIVDTAISLEPGNMFYRLAKNNLQLNSKEYDDCIALGDSLIHNNDQNAEAYYNVGAAYFNKALLRNQKTENLKNKKKEVNALYEKALPYVERYRILAPKNTQRWAPMLYTIYLNLNKGKEFEEIDKLMKNL